MKIKEKVLKEFKVDINTWNCKLIERVIDRILSLKNEEVGKVIDDLFKFDNKDLSETHKLTISKKELKQKLGIEVLK